MKAAIFDLDGTLLDSMWVWSKVDFDFLGKRGIDPPEDYVENISSLNFREAAAYTVERFSLGDSVEEVMQEWYDLAKVEYSSSVKMKEGALDYLLALKDAGVKLAVATSLPPVLHVPALKNNGILHLFDAVCCTDEVERGKRFPDVYYLAMRRIQEDPESCVIFEDIPPAVKSAKLTGARVCAVFDEASALWWKEMSDAADMLIYDYRTAPLPEGGELD